MDKKVWGPQYWFVLHSSCATYHPSRRASFRNFIYSFKDILPCEECRANFTRLLTRFPPDPYMDSKERLFAWSYLIHDQANKELGKASPSFATVQSVYFGRRMSCTSGSCRLR